MKRYWLLLYAAFVVGPPIGMAQNVTGYRNMTEPLLFLVREPAVLDDLALSQTQRTKLEELNHSFDSQLLQSRKMAAKDANAVIGKVLTATREKLPQILNSSQQTRIQQIKNRLRGISCVLMPKNAERLGLNDRQKTQIEEIVDETKQVRKENSSRTYQGKEAHEKARQAVVAAQKAEQQKIFGILDKRQQQILSNLAGRSFDVTKLGKVSFKAPEFAAGDKWINSKALQLKKLRGKVVALHFYAFG